MKTQQIKKAANAANAYKLLCNNTKAEPFNEGFVEGVKWAFKWINVNDGKPEKLTLVVLINKDKNKMEVGYYIESIDRFFKNNERAGNFFNATHWTPLPELP